MTHLFYMELICPQNFRLLQNRSNSSYKGIHSLNKMLFRLTQQMYSNTYINKHMLALRLKGERNKYFLLIVTFGWITVHYPVWNIFVNAFYMFNVLCCLVKSCFTGNHNRNKSVYFLIRKHRTNKSDKQAVTLLWPLTCLKIIKLKDLTNVKDCIPYLSLIKVTQWCGLQKVQKNIRPENRLWITNKLTLYVVIY